MTADNGPSIKDLYVTEVLPGGIVAKRSNPDITATERSDVIARQRMANLESALGAKVVGYFSLEDMIKQ